MRGSRVAGIAFVLLAASGVALDLSASRPALAAEESEVYKNVYAGWKWWHVYCYRCHGMNAIGGGGLGPNLLDPNEKFTQAEFLKKVQQGVPDKGMQAWDKLLDDKQILQLYDYVQARFDKVLPPGRPDEIGPNGGPWSPPEGWPKRK